LEKGIPRKRPDAIAPAIKALLAAAGIPDGFLPNLVRHAMTNDLYGARLDEKK
jgi:hypothetical protein